MPTAPLPEIAVYICYARADGAKHAVWVQQALAARKIESVVDIRPIDPARDLSAVTEQTVERARCVVVCVTAAVRRPDLLLRREIGYAIALNKPIYVVRLEDVVPPTSVVNKLKFDLFRNKVAEFDRLVGHLGNPKDIPPSGKIRIDPFLGYLKTAYVRTIHELSRSGLGDGVQGTPLTVGYYRGAWGGGADTGGRTFDLFAEAYTAYEGRMILAGPPGAGKTTMLLAWARDALAARIDSPTEPLPLIARVSSWDVAARPPIIDWLAGRERMRKEVLKEAFEGSDVLLLLDALDEVTPAVNHEGDPRAHFLDALNAALGRNRVVLTCRLQDYQAMGQTSRLLGVATLLPPEAPQRTAYLQPTPELAQAVQQMPTLAQVVATPLMLNIFRHAYAGRAVALRALADLDADALRERILAAYIEQRYAEVSSKRNLPMQLHEVRGILSELAYRNAVDAMRTAPPGVVRPPDLNLLPPDWQAVFAELAAYLRLLVPRPDGLLRFPHIIFRDYFAYPLAIARLREKDAAKRQAACEALTQMGDVRGVPALVVMLGDVDNGVQERAAHALRQIGPPAIPMLLRGLKAPNERIRLQAKLVLATMPGPEGKDALRRVMSRGE